MLSITGHLHLLKTDALGWWLSERQLPSGGIYSKILKILKRIMFLIKIFLGLNGRPEKLPDVCYSWWVVSSLSIIGRTEWLDKSQLKKFIMACQDTETGGFSDRPSDMPDPFHTLFGLAGLSLLGESSLKAVNPVFCMPQYVIDRLKISPQILS